MIRFHLNELSCSDQHPGKAIFSFLTPYAKFPDIKLILWESYCVCSFVTPFVKPCKAHPWCEHSCDTLILISLEEFIV